MSEGFISPETGLLTALLTWLAYQSARLNRKADKEDVKAMRNTIEKMGERQLDIMHKLGVEEGRHKE